MNQFYIATYYNLQIGDRLIRSKGILSTHHGIYVGVHHGIPVVAENQVGHGVRYISLSDFLLNNSSNLKEIRKFQGNEYARNQIIPRINNILGHKYDLVNFNCEHFAEYIQHGRANSSQVDNAVASFGILAFVGLLAMLGGGK